MVSVQSPDGQTRELADGATVAEALRQIDPQPARPIIAAKVNDCPVDLASRLTTGQATLQALTMENPDGLQIVRHSCAHVMAEAICALWPQTQLVYGPPVENGFYYDIDLDHALSPDDFARIEARMAQIVKEDRPFTRYELPREEAMLKLEREGNPYKIDNAQRAEGDRLSFYVTGTRDSGCWEDLCRGPHVPSTAHVGAFKIMQVAGAYWHGDASQKMLQRVYGTAWPTPQELQRYLHQLEEAKKRDHRRIGQELGLFLFDPLVGPGLVLWKPRGAVLRHALECFMREELIRRGYQPVYTPHVGRVELYQTSGHYPYFEHAQFPQMIFARDEARELLKALREARAAGRPLERAVEERLVREAGLALDSYPFDEQDADRKFAIVRALAQTEEAFILKPMNCPHHIRIYASDQRSYRDLPIRLAEFGTVYRYEKSGEIHGLTRVRGFTQDDAHIFCTSEQLQQELEDCIELTRKVLKLLGLSDFRVRIGLPDESDKYAGSIENWRAAASSIREAVRASGLDFVEERGEAAFYGPKIDFIVHDCIGREWQLGTVQADPNLPERFGLTYVGDDNREHRPVMVHRAPFGSLERFVGILIEHFAGAFPLWLSPVQAAICTVSDKSAEYARQVFQRCFDAGLRVELDNSGERIGAKIRRATLLKVPYILVIGEQEAAAGTVNVRTREGQQLGNCTVPEFLAACAVEVSTRGVKSPDEAGRASS